MGVTGIAHISDTMFVACFNNGIYQSKDKGKSWTSESINFCASFMSVWNNRVFLSNTLGTNDGLFIINPGKSSLHRIDLGLSNEYIMYFKCIDNTVYVNNLEGIWQISAEDFVRFYMP